MMRPSLVAKRPVQQAMAANHAAAELYHEGFQVTSWDVWIRFFEPPQDVWLYVGKEYNKHTKDKLQGVPQRPGATTTTVQWMVIKSDAGDFEAEAPVGSATFEIRMEGIQCRYWEAWLMINKYEAGREPHGISQWWKGVKKRTTETVKKALNASLSKRIGLCPRQLDKYWLSRTIKRSTHFRSEGYVISNSEKCQFLSNQHPKVTEYDKLAQVRYSEILRFRLQRIPVPRWAQTLDPPSI